MQLKPIEALGEAGLAIRVGRMSRALSSLMEAVAAKDVGNVWLYTNIILGLAEKGTNMSGMVIGCLLKAGRADAVAQATIPDAYEATEVLARWLGRKETVVQMAVNMNLVLEFLEETARG